jgi:hypothetical protein
LLEDEEKGDAVTAQDCAEAAERNDKAEKTQGIHVPDDSIRPTKT